MQHQTHDVTDRDTWCYIFNANVMGITSRGCSVGNDPDELASQRESGDDVDK